MQFLSVKELRAQAARVWRELPRAREIVITNNGHPIAILSAVDETNVETTLNAFRRARAIEAVASLQRESLEKGKDKLMPGEIQREVKAARQNRRR